jgi:uncharacterized protein
MKLVRFAILTLCGFAVFALTMTFTPLLPAWGDYAARGGLLFLFGVLWLAARGGRLGPYRPVFFACFTATASFSLAYYFSDYGLALFHLTTATPAGTAIGKASQALVTVAGIVVLAKLSGQDLGSLYIRKGRLALGLVLGLAGAALFVCVTFIPGGPFFSAASTAGGLGKLAPLVPWLLLFVLSNAFMEELLFRGLFLGRYEALTGKWLALLATALVFALAHMQVTYTAQVAGFVAFVFVLGLLWGLLMQKSKSIWGSVLFHAGADVAVILPIMQGMGS